MIAIKKQTMQATQVEASKILFTLDNSSHLAPLQDRNQQT